MAKEEAKGEGKGEAPATPAAAKAPLFSKTGLIVLVVLCLVCAGTPVLLMHKPDEAGKKGDPANHGGEEHSGHGAPKPFKPPAFRNIVELDEISMPYRDAGGPRRSLKVTVVLEVVTKVEPVMGAGEHGGAGAPKAPEGKEHEFDEDGQRKRTVERLKYKIYDKICNILRGRVPEDFATNELIGQTQQQIKRAINDEIFDRQEVIQDVAFTKSQF